jgi:hypothetical protein
MESGWNELLRALSSDFRGFLDGLDSLHYFVDHIVYKAKLKGPSFRCEQAHFANGLTSQFQAKNNPTEPCIYITILDVKICTQL